MATRNVAAVDLGAESGRKDWRVMGRGEWHLHSEEQQTFDLKEHDYG